MKLTRLMRTLLGCWLLLAACLIHPTTASAQSAEEQFTHGQQLFEAGRYDEALPIFRAALASSQSPNARLYVGRCLTKLGKFVEAYTEMKRTFDDADTRAKQEDRYLPTRDSAAAELALLDRKVGKLVVALVAPAADVRVSLDGKPLAGGSIGVPVVVMPGEVLVVAHDDSEGHFEQSVQIAAGQTKTVAVALATPQQSAGGDNPGGPGGDHGAGEPTTSTGGGIGTLRAVGIGAAGLGVAGMVVFSITGSMARSKFSDLEDSCGGVRCTDLAQAETVDSGKSLQTVANVTAIVGGALLAAGAVMIIFGGPSDDEAAAGRAPSWHAAAIPLEGGGLVAVGGRF